MRYKLCNFRCDRAISKGTFLVEESSYSSVSELPFKWFSWTFGPRTSHACATSSIRLAGIGQEIRALYLRTNYLFFCISTSIRGIFLNLNTSHFPRMRYKRCKFGYDRWVMKGTLHGVQCTFSSGTPFTFEGFSWKFVSRTFQACDTNVIRKCGCDR